MKKLISALICIVIVISTFSFVFSSSAASLVAPVINIKNKANGIYLNWEKVEGAKEYELYKLNSEKKWVKILSTTKRSYTDTDVKHAVKYSYKLRAVNGSIKGDYSNASYMYLKNPSLKSVSNTLEGVKIKWAKIDKVDLYRVYRKEVNGDYKLIAKVSGDKTEYVDKKASNAVTYTYTVAAVKGDYRSLGSSEPLTINYIAAVKSVIVKNSPSGVTVTWKKLDKATGYYVFRKISGEKDWVKIANVKSATKYIDKSTSYGKKNYYKVKAYISGKGEGAFSDYSYVYSVNPNKKMVALTFDDGPYTPVTNKILDSLQKHNSRATFFVVGSRLNTYKDCLVREDKLGCQIACHTYNHTTLTSASDATVKSEISKTNDLIKSISGQSVKMVRAPGGSVNDRVKKLVDYPLVNWSVDTLDWKSRNADSVVSNIKNNVGDGSIVLMHDLYSSTADAAVRIIPWLIEKGYQLVTVSEMMDAKGVNFQKGTLYYRA